MKPKKIIPEKEPNIRNVKCVAELVDLMKNKKTILIASIKNLPASQFQEITKKLRGKAIVKVPKKNLIIRALDSSGKEAIKDLKGKLEIESSLNTVASLKEQIKNSVAILFSDLDAFELASELVTSKSPAKAKAGQEAPEDIEVQAGLTDLIPGPAISELGSLGIQIKIEKGKINIREPKIIVKKGEKISTTAAEVMNKLDIKPFLVGFTPLCAFDNQESKFYAELKIDKEATLEELKSAYAKALPFAIEIGYPTKDTISFLIGKAGMHEKALEGLKKEEKVEEKKEEAQTPEDKSEEENK